MINPSPESIVKALFELYGYTFSQRLEIRLERGRSEELFKLLVASVLLNERTGWQSSVAAARAFYRRGWTSAESMAASSVEERVAVLDETSYKYDGHDRAERLGALALDVIERYGGDIKMLRRHAGRVAVKERRLLEALKGMSVTAAGFFLQEIQLNWHEAYPFADALALRGAGKLGFRQDAQKLAELVRKQEEYPILAASLLQMDMDNKSDYIYSEALKLESFVEIEP